MTFTFRHVVAALGLDECNETHWAVGQMLRKWADRQGIEPERILTEKTDPNPSVAAPHCIAHYPMPLFRAALEEIGGNFAERGRQGDLFGHEGL